MFRRPLAALPWLRRCCRMAWIGNRLSGRNVPCWTHWWRVSVSWSLCCGITRLRRWPFPAIWRGLRLCMTVWMSFRLFSAPTRRCRRWNATFWHGLGCLHRWVQPLRGQSDTSIPTFTRFPSGVDVAHFRPARQDLPEPPDQRAIPRPRLGFYGVLDERLDQALLAELAALRPDWQIILVGPVVKVEAAHAATGRQPALPGRQSL